jgi:GDP/GTP exchange factor required for growth at low temperature
MSEMSTDHDDQSSPTTPVLSLGPDATVSPPTASASPHLDHPAAETVMEPSETITQSTSSSSRPSSLPPSDTPPHLILPIPTPSLNKSQSSVVFSHTIVTSEDDWGSLPPEVATADISIAREYTLHSIFLCLFVFASRGGSCTSADISLSLMRMLNQPSADGSFVETSSGPAARELKRRYDQHLGVGKDVRSPYAITAFVNQHGKSMYRVGSVLNVSPFLRMN